MKSITEMRREGSKGLICRTFSKFFAPSPNLFNRTTVSTTSAPSSDHGTTWGPKVTGDA